MKPMKAILLIVSVVIVAVVGFAGLANTADVARAGAPAPTPTPPSAEWQAMQRGTPAPTPAPSLYPASTAAQILANIPNDPLFKEIMGGAGQPGSPYYNPRLVGATVGTPVLARGLKPGSPPNFLVPLISATTGKPVAVFSIGPSSDGKGAIAAYAGWPYDTIPAMTEASAVALASAPGDPAKTVELVWARVRGRDSGGIAPFWHIVRTSGAEFFIFADGKLTPASDVMLL